jgi:ADP-ribosylglycohydrolase
MGGNASYSSKECIKKYLLEISPEEYPLQFYFPSSSPAEEKVGKIFWGRHSLSTRENIQFMESDDDIRYTVIGQKILLEKGYAFTTEDVALAWIRWLPYRSVCTAETQAYRNLVNRLTHMNSDENNNIDFDWVAQNENPYREWIGADIRIDSYGYACPGNPELAAELAWRDARLSHVKNGIYGSMLFAAMIAAAFVTNDPHEIVEAGLSQIPEKSRLYVEMRQVIAICKKHNDQYAAFEKVHEEIYQLLGHYHPVHTNNNAGLVIAALLLGQHDFEKVITTAVMGGWDTDCTGATAGSIFGAMVGSSALPKKWTEPLNGILKSDMIGYHPISFDECAQLSLEIIKKGK